MSPRSRSRRATRRRLSLAAAAACSAAVALSVAATAVPAAAAEPVPTAVRVAAGGSETVSRAVSFRVRNVNRSAFPCASDGKTYTVSGHLVGPAAALAGDTAGSTTLFLHGLNFGEFLWDYQAVPGYDFSARLAAHGQTSVVVDRLGYGASGKPDGTNICVGSRADIAHQIVQDLKSGDYRVAGHPATTFRRVALAGHSYSGQIAELEARSFHDVDALAVVSYTDQGSSPLNVASGIYSATVCAAGGKPQSPGGPAHYAPYGDPAGAKAAIFYRPDPRVAADVIPKLTLNPCQDMLPFAQAAAANLQGIHGIDVPVLVVAGGKDALFPAAAQAKQATLFTGSPAVTRVTVPDAGHAITLQPTSGVLVDGMASWLAGTVGTPTGGVATGIGDSGRTDATLLSGGAAALAAAAGIGTLAARRRRRTG